MQVLETLTQGIDIALDNRDMAVPLLQNVFPLERMPLLSEIPLDKTLDEETYRKELKHLKQRLGELHNRLYRKKVPVIIAYEGWDAAGKGGNIKRITSALDPRGMRCIRSQARSRMRRQDIICGVSGQDCRRPVTLQFLTVRGTDV